MMKLFTTHWFPLRLHSWGGLGSQLHSILILIRLANRYPKRQITLIHHTSGVTRRYLETQVIPPNIKAISIDDYSFNEDKKIPSKDFISNLMFFVKNLRKQIALRTQFYKIVNSEAQFAKLKPWTFDVRGHYTFLHIDKPELEQLHKLVFKDVSSISQKSFRFFLHFRLGDLMNYENKTSINPSSIGALLDRMSSSESLKDNSLLIMSDSPEQINSELLPSLRKFNWEISESKNLLGLMYTAIDSEVFLGTNSKLSIWIAAFRTTLYPTRQSFLPMQIRRNIAYLVDRQFLDNTIIFY